MRPIKIDHTKADGTPMTPSQFKRYDEVVQKADKTQKMIVTDGPDEDGEYGCQWMAKGHKSQSDRFKPELLERYKRA